MQALRAVRVVTAVLDRPVLDSKRRIFGISEKTFFSRYDVWHYIEISDTKLCKLCRANAEMEGGYYTGNRIRGFFPELEILDEDTIEVNEHPNCRCVLVRVAKTSELWKKTVYGD